MTDLISIKRKVQEEEVAYRAAVSESTWSKIGSAINFLIDNATFAVGDLVWSVLDETEFQTERNTQWVLCDGRSVLGTDYQTLTGDANIPDVRGRFTRMKDYGTGRNPDGDTAVGTVQTQSNDGHYHYGHSEYYNTPLGAGADTNAVSSASTTETYNASTTSNKKYQTVYAKAPGTTTASQDWCHSAIPGSEDISDIDNLAWGSVKIVERITDNNGFTNRGVRTPFSGGNESRPTNIIFNAYIKINN